MLSLGQNNDNLIVIQNVVDYIAGPIADMTGWITIYDQSDNSILAGCNELAITYATTYNGQNLYYVDIPATVQITPGTKYRALFQSTNYGVQREVMLQGVRMLSQ